MENSGIYKTCGFIIERILADKKIPPGAKLILLNLLHRTGNKNYCFPSQKRIAKDVGLSERQVRNHLNLLKRLKIVLWKRGAINPKNNNQLYSNKYDLSAVMQLVKKVKNTEE